MSMFTHPSTSGDIKVDNALSVVEQELKPHLQLAIERINEFLATADSGDATQLLHSYAADLHATLANIDMHRTRRATGRLVPALPGRRDPRT